jgi:aryl-alcohol dehydrogenase-like predicted oxidoreductase
MGLDYLDLYLVHWPDLDIPLEDTIEAMAKVKEEGKARFIGVSNFSVEQLAKAQSITDIACCESPYNLMWRDIEARGLIDFCLDNNIGILTYSSLGQGLFAGKIRSVNDIPKRDGDVRQYNLLFKDKGFENSLKILKILDELSEKYDKTPAKIALNWVVNQKGITSAIAGIESMKELNDNLGAIDFKMDDSDYSLLSKKGKQLSSIFDYAAYNMFGMKYEDIKIDAMIDDLME